MNLEENIKQEYYFNGKIINKDQKQVLANKIAEKIKDNDVIGIGSGSTCYLATIAIKEKMKKENITITAIPTSYEIKILCDSLNIPTTTLLEKTPDWSFDGADEVSSNNWLVKGRGGAMYKEKLNIAASPITYILVDNSKMVNNICDKFPIPVEVTFDAINLVRESLINMGAKDINLRMSNGKDGPVITENGNVILDVKFDNVDETYEKRLKNIVGVVETGLFIGYNIVIVKE